MLLAGFKKIEISKQLNISKMTVHRVDRRLTASVSLTDRPQSGRPQVISEEGIKKAFENDLWQKMTTPAQIKKISVSTVLRKFKKMRGKIWDVPENSCWLQQWFRSIWRLSLVCWRIWRITGIVFSFFPMIKFSPWILSTTNGKIGW